MLARAIQFLLDMLPQSSLPNSVYDLTADSVFRGKHPPVFRGAINFQFFANLAHFYFRQLRACISLAARCCFRAQSEMMLISTPNCLGMGVCSISVSTRHLFGGNARVMGISARLVVTTLRGAILVVLRLCSLPKMIGINAKRVVAARAVVANEYLGPIPGVDDPSDNGSLSGFPSKPKVTVAMRCAGRPKPAPVRAGNLIDLRPEAGEFHWSYVDLFRRIRDSWSRFKHECLSCLGLGRAVCFSSREPVLFN